MPARGDDLEKFGVESSQFYLTPTKQRYEELQSNANRLADSLSARGNAALLAAAMIAKISQTYHWDISGKGRISDKAREISEGSSEVAKYVQDDAIVDLSKLDVWWGDFFATGDKQYLNKILRYARHPQPGEHASDFMVPAMAAWSFKSNCQQHKAVLEFAKQCLEANAFPEKKDFLKACVESAKLNAAPNH